MTRNTRTALGLVLALGFIASAAAWLGQGRTAQAAAAPPMTQAQRLAALGCNANQFPTATWIYISRGEPAVGMNRVALLCALGTPDDVRTVRTASGETEFQTWHRAGQRALVVQTQNGIVETIAD